LTTYAQDHRQDASEIDRRAEPKCAAVAAEILDQEPRQCRADNAGQITQEMNEAADTTLPVQRSIIIST
jgi:hypothetical protein